MVHIINDVALPVEAAVVVRAHHGVAAGVAANSRHWRLGDDVGHPDGIDGVQAVHRVDRVHGLRAVAGVGPVVVVECVLDLLLLSRST